MQDSSGRRKFCKAAASAVLAVPILFLARHASARSNSALRAQLQYQEHPKDGNSCTSCLEFTASKVDPTLGTCKVIPDDDEILAQGYCTAWNSM